MKKNFQQFGLIAQIKKLKRTKANRTTERDKLIEKQLVRDTVLPVGRTGLGRGTRDIEVEITRCQAWNHGNGHEITGWRAESGAEAGHGWVQQPADRTREYDAQATRISVERNADQNEDYGTGAWEIAPARQLRYLERECLEENPEKITSLIEAVYSEDKTGSAK